MAENNGDNPDTNICLVEKVENLMGETMDLLLQLKPKSKKQQKISKKLIDNLNFWQTTKLFDLRKAYE